jgi:hypothetical protein
VREFVLRALRLAALMKKFLLAIGLLVPALAFGQVPQTIHYQGFLTTNAGAPVNGDREATFRIYAVSSGGTHLWSEELVVSAANGRFEIVLGNVTPIALPFDAQYWLGVKIGLDAEMTPRQPLTAAPYALRARSLDAAAQVQGAQITGAISGATISGGTLTQLQTQFAPAAPFAPPQGNTLTTFTSFIGGVGGGTSTAIGADGLPVITFWDNNAGLLRVIKCLNAACTASTVNTADGGGASNVGNSNSLAIGLDGLPVISYRDFTNGNLKVAKCLNPECSGASTVTTLDGVAPSTDVGWNSSIAIGGDGLPVIAYYDSTNQDLKVAKCADAACAQPAQIATVDVGNNPQQRAGEFTSMAIGVDGFPVIAYWDNFAVLKVAKCTNALCTAGTNTITPVTNALFGESTSIAIGADGLPVIAFSDQGKLSVAKCVNADCSGTSTVTPLTSAFNSGELPALAIGADGLPVIAFRDSASGQALKMAKCANAACTGASAISTIAADGHLVVDISMTIGADGLPVVSYHDNSIFRQMVVKCANAFCSPFFRRR